MKTIHTLSLSLAVNDWKMSSHQPRILHIFDHACNLINERGDILSIVTPQIGNGPFNLVLEDNICLSDSVDHESSISILPAQLTLGNISIHTTKATLWNPRPDWEMLHTKREHLVAQIKQLQINDYLNQDGLPTTQSSGGISTGSVISLCKTDTWNQFASSLAAGDVRSAITLAQHLAGLGVGLTPTGDDFIMGTLYAARIIHPADIADQLAQATANAAAPLTTSLSAAWLRSAGKGEAGILWHELFDALLSSRRSQIQMSIDKILDVGATSGADALAGFLGTFISYVELQKKHVIP